MSESKRRTITLYDRPPVTIREADWPVLASAEWHWHEGEHESQAFRTAKAILIVRQHDDGRYLVYGIAERYSAWKAECGYERRGGVLANANAQVPEVLREVGERLADKLPDAETIRELIDKCISDLPAEEL